VSDRTARRLATIGYQGAPAAAVLGLLEAAGVDLLVDVRAVAASRRPGFSKSQLSAGVSALGIGYLHLRGLGTPPDGRLAARSGRYADLERIYREHLEGAPARAETAQLTELVRSGRRVCLLCFEHQPEHCHRRLVAERVAEELDVEIAHLMP